MHRANQCPSHSHGNRVAQLTAGAAIVVAPAAAAAAAPAAAIGPGADAALARRVAAASAERLRDRSWVFGFFSFLLHFCLRRKTLCFCANPTAPPPVPLHPSTALCAQRMLRFARICCNFSLSANALAGKF